MTQRAFTPHAPPISLRDVVQQLGSVAALGRIVAQLPGAIEQGTKANETWRYQFGPCFVLGYRESAVVAGDHPATTPLLAARIRAAVGQPVAPRTEAAPPSEPIYPVIRPRLVPRDEQAGQGASYDERRDWTGMPWAADWLAHCTAHPRPPRTIEQRIREPLDPFGWAAEHGLCST